MPPRKDLILILDLECTGAEKKVEEIVQVGIVALGAPSWQMVAELQYPVLPSEAAWDRMMANDVVRNMHEKSGLLRHLNQAKANYPEKATPAAVDGYIIDWLIKVGGEDTSHIPYGGSGVAHYDRPFIERQLPRFNRRITHWPLDVGSTRRQAELAGRTDWPTPPGGAKTHDALEDARFHAREFRFCLSILRPKELGPGPWEGH